MIRNIGLCFCVYIYIRTHQSDWTKIFIAKQFEILGLESSTFFLLTSKNVSNLSSGQREMVSSSRFMFGCVNALTCTILIMFRLSKTQEMETQYDIYVILCSYVIPFYQQKKKQFCTSLDEFSQRSAKPICILILCITEVRDP